MSTWHGPIPLTNNPTPIVLYHDGEDGADGMPIPGVAGATGATGATGAAGAAGIAGQVIHGMDGEDGESPAMIPGIPGPAATNVILPRGYIDGLTLSVSGTTTQTLSISEGVCRDDTNGVNITLAAFTKVLQNTSVAWSAGTGGNGINPTAAVLSGQWYYVWAISKTDGTADIFFSTASSPTLPTGFTYKRYIGSILTLVSGTASLRYIKFFTQVGNDFLWITAQQDYTYVGGAQVGANVSVTLGFVPPALQVLAHLAIRFATTVTTGNRLYVAANAQTEAAQGAAASPIRATTNTTVTTVASLVQADVWCATGVGSIAISTDTPGGSVDSVDIDVRGWVDYRGQYDLHP